MKIISLLFCHWIFVITVFSFQETNRLVVLLVTLLYMGYYNGRLIWHETWSQYFSGRTKPSISRHFLWMCFSSIHWVLGESNSPWRCLQFSLCTTSVGNVFVSHTATVHVSRPSKWPGIMKGKRSVWIWQLVDDEIWGNCSVDYPNQESILIWCVTQSPLWGFTEGVILVPGADKWLAVCNVYFHCSYFFIHMPFYMDREYLFIHQEIIVFVILWIDFVYFIFFIWSIISNWLSVLHSAMLNLCSFLIPFV